MRRILGTIRVECSTCQGEDVYEGEHLYGWSIRQLLLLAGWLCEGEQDICPQCAEERQRVSVFMAGRVVS